MLRFSLLESDGLPLFWQSAGERWGIKSCQKATCQKRWSSGLTDTQGNVLGNGRSKSTKPLVVQSCVNIVSVGTFCVKTCRSFKECRTPGKCKFRPLHANRRLRQMWDWIEHWPIVVAFLTTYYILSVSIISHLFSPHTIIRSTEENPNRVMTGKFFVLAS